MFVKLFRWVLFIAFIPLTQAVDIQSWTLDNGAKVMYVHSPQIPIIDIKVSFDAGVRRDASSKIGIASFTGALMDTGTTTLSEEAIRNQIARLAINLNTSTSLEYASLDFRSQTKAEILQPALKLANQVLTQPAFDAKILKREQERSIQGLKQGQTNAAFLADRAITQMNYPKHPYGFPAKTTEQTIQAVKREDLVHFYQKHYVTEGAVVSIVGAVNRNEADKIAREILQGLSRGQKQASVTAVTIDGGQSKNIAHPASQAHIQIGLPVFTRHDPDYYALLVGNYILGSGGFDSRLMKVLRDENGLVYGVSSSLAPYEQKGEFSIEFSTKKNEALRALQLTRDTLTQFIAQGPTDAELKQAKNNIIGGFPLRFDSNGKLIAYLDVIGRYDLPLSFLDDYPEKVRKISKDDIRYAWQKRIDPALLNTVIVGAEEKQNADTL